MCWVTSASKLGIGFEIVDVSKFSGVEMSATACGAPSATFLLLNSSIMQRSITEVREDTRGTEKHKERKMFGFRADFKLATYLP